MNFSQVLEEIFFFLGKKNFIQPTNISVGPLDCAAVWWTGRQYALSLYFDGKHEYRWVFQNRTDDTYYHESCLTKDPPSTKLTEYLRRTMYDCQ